MVEGKKIDSLIIAYLDSSISDDDAGKLKLWLQADDKNLQYFTEIKGIWDNCNFLSDNKEELEVAINRVRQKVNPTRKLEIQHPQKLSIWFSRIAVVLIIGIVTYSLSIFLQQYTGKTDTVEVAASNNIIIIPKGQKGQIVLSDGTKIWLNSETTLEYSTAFGAERKVFLSGEAYFEVKSDEAHPFLVETPRLNVKVTGTTFNIKAYEQEDKMETTLVEGRLSLLNNDLELVVLQPNELAIYSHEKNSLNISNLGAKLLPYDTDSHTPKIKDEKLSPIELVGVWKEEKLIFQDESLENMIPKLERWFNRKIHVSDADLFASQYNGKFVYNETIYQVLDVICRSSANLEYTEIDREFYISKK